MKKLFEKIYDKTAITVYSVITMLVAMSSTFLAVYAIFPGSVVFAWVALVLGALSIVFAVYSVVSKPHRVLRYNKAKRDLAELRASSADISNDKAYKHAKKAVKKEDKAERL